MASRLLKTIKESERLKSKTFIFSTNNPAYLKHADRVIYISEGLIKFNGGFEDFKMSPEFNQLQQVNLITFKGGFEDFKMSPEFNQYHQVIKEEQEEDYEDVAYLLTN